MRSRLGRCLSACATVAVVCAAASTPTSSNAATHTVVIEGVRFDPEALTIARGDTVTWINKDPFPHNVTAKGAFESQDISAGKSWKYTARKAGTYPYVCTLHPNMQGTLTVK